MNRQSGKLKKIVCALLFLLLFSQVVLHHSVFEPALQSLMDKGGRLAGFFALPSFGFKPTAVVSVETGVDIQPQTQAEQPNTTVAATDTTQPAADGDTAVAAASDAAGKILTQQVGLTGATNAPNLHINNKTGVSVDAAKQLAIRPDIKIIKNKQPQVLIMHTHATECYFPKVSETYSASWETRSTDNSKNVVRVGDEIAKQLNAAGIVTVHDTTQHDREAYSGSYARARTTIQNYLEKYPSIDVVLDIHRDAVTYDDGTKLKPTVSIDGKNAAQIMIATGCNSGSVTEYPDWEQNFRFAIRVQQACETMYPGLARSMYFVSKKYNHDLNHGSILVEMGSEANTLEEAIYAGELLGKALVRVLDGLQD